MDTERMLARSHDIGTKVALLFRKRAENAQRQFTERLAHAAEDNGMAELATNPAAGAKLWSDWARPLCSTAEVGWCGNRGGQDVDLHLQNEAYARDTGPDRRR